MQHDFQYPSKKIHFVGDDERVFIFTRENNWRLLKFSENVSEDETFSFDLIKFTCIIMIFTYL